MNRLTVIVAIFCIISLFTVQCSSLLSPLAPDRLIWRIGHLRSVDCPFMAINYGSKLLAHDNLRM